LLHKFLSLCDILKHRWLTLPATYVRCEGLMHADFRGVGMSLSGCGSSSC
jgi:hypothetical protein